MACTVVSYISFEELTTEEMHLSVLVSNSLLLLYYAWNTHPIDMKCHKNNSADRGMKIIISPFPIVFSGAKEVTQQLKVQVALLKNLVCFPAPTLWLTTVRTAEPKTFSDLIHTKHTHVYKQVCKGNIYIHKTKRNKSFQRVVFIITN